MVGYVEGTRLQLTEDEAFQRRDWMAQRVAWVVFFLVLLAALLGLFGSGPLSTGSRRSAGAQIDYERFARNGRPMTLTITLDSTPGDSVIIDMSDDYLAAAPLERTEPEARAQAAGEGARRFEFPLAGEDGGKVVFHFDPRSVGLAKGWIAVNGGEPVSFSTFFYP